MEERLEKILKNIVKWEKAEAKVDWDIFFKTIAYDKEIEKDVYKGLIEIDALSTNSDGNYKLMTEYGKDMTPGGFYFTRKEDVIKVSRILNSLKIVKFEDIK